jgi:hypothetical protein
MALISPGVEVTVIDESFYTPAEPGTVPLVVVATAENKLNGAGTAVASGTLESNVGRVFKVTSQRELVELFGAPFFEKTASGSPVHGGERNEYGLLAAYSLLGVSNAAFILRAGVNLNELEGQTDTPGATPDDGQWWFDTRSTTWGVNEWNGAAIADGGQKFTAKTPLVLTDDDVDNIGTASAYFGSLGGAPKAAVGTIGDYCVVWQTVLESGTYSASKELARLWYKSAGNSALGIAAGDWVLVGSPEWAASHPTAYSTAAITGSLVAGHQFTVNGTTVTCAATVAGTISNFNTAMNGSGITAVFKNSRVYIYSDGTSTAEGGDSTTIAGGTGGVVLANVGPNTPLATLNITAGTYMAPALAQQPHTSVPLFRRSDFGTTVNGRPTGSLWLKTTEPNNGARMRLKKYNAATSAWVAQDAPLYANPHAALYYLDRSGGGSNLGANVTFVQTNALEHVGSYDATTGAVNGFDAPDETTASAVYRAWIRASGAETTITSKVIGSGTLAAGSNRSFTIKQSITGDVNLSAAATVTFNTAGTADDAFTIAAAINALSFVDSNGDAITNNVVASVSSTNELVIKHKTAGDIRMHPGSGLNVLATLFTVFDLEDGTGTANFYALTPAADATYGITDGAVDDYLASLWKPMANIGFDAVSNEPLNEPADGQLWYNPSFGDVDIMIHNGTTWVGYLDSTSPFYSATASLKTDPAGPIVSATMPETQSDYTPLVNGDLWISTADLENFPTIYKYNPDVGTTLAARWVLLDKTDQTSEDGVLFADARAGTSGGTATQAPSGSIAELLSSNFLDFDAPDPDLYPKGMLLWNTRVSGGNVKRYNNSYVDLTADNPRMGDVSMGSYWPDRWTTASPNNEDGSGSFGRKAQRSCVVAALKSVVDTSLEVRDEERRNFNLISCPGYPELLSNLINLNLDRRVTAFVVGDTPLRLQADATSLTNWGTNANLAFDNGDDGIVTYDEYAAVWYPNGFTTDLSGTNAVVPASHMMLRTIALSDQVSYPWFAPAGTRRGGITNATSVGYIDSDTGEFNVVALNNGQRDTLYDLKINPIPFFVGVGLVAYGQKTRARNASALDRINVARLVVYLRNQLSKLARPYVFEPNDQITRDEIKQAVESLLLELVGLRAIYDFAVVCDESNNTPARIDRNELYVDVAIEPTKAVEFIYIPLRLKNTGEI